MAANGGAPAPDANPKIQPFSNSQSDVNHLSVVIDQDTRPAHLATSLSTTPSTGKAQRRRYRVSALPAVKTAKVVNTFKRGAHNRGHLHSITEGEEQQPQDDSKDSWHLPGHVLNPMDIRMYIWFNITVAGAIFTGWIMPYYVAFSEFPALTMPGYPRAGVEYVLMVIFAVDMALRFNTAYVDRLQAEDDAFVADFSGERLVISRPLIARRYLRRRFWVDLLSLVPLDWIVLAALGLKDSRSNTAYAINTLKLLRMLRLYRVVQWIGFLERHHRTNYAAVTILRNFMLTFAVMHWAACAMYFTSRLYGFGEHTMLGAVLPFIKDNENSRYIYYFYWAVTTFSTVGYGDLHPYAVGEVVVCCIYLFTNIAVSAYIIGSVSMLVSKHDQRFDAFRQRISSLTSYSKINGLDHDLKERMRDHLRLHYGNEDANDEVVLQYYPTPIRRRVLRDLYQATLQEGCPLFSSCTTRFLDAVMAISRVELFMPDVEIITAGDLVHELYILVRGECRARAASEVHTAQIGGLGGESAPEMEAEGSSPVRGEMLGGQAAGEGEGGKLWAARWQRPSHILEGEPIGELPFFTERAAAETVWTKRVSRVLILPREAFMALEAAFPNSFRQTLNNLLRYIAQDAQDEFPGMGTEALLELLSEEAVRNPLYSERQRQCLRNLLHVRELLYEAEQRVRDARATELFDAASKDDVPRIKRLLEVDHVHPDVGDYADRTALMIAASKGQRGAVQQLLLAEADLHKVDSTGNSALLEACREGHDDVVQLLRKAGAQLELDETGVASALCEAVTRGDAGLLRRLIQAGASPDAKDYNGRTPLHLAVSECNVPLMRLLVEDGADVRVRDRWGVSPLDEARRVGADAAVEYLAARVSEEEAADSLRVYENRRTEDFQAVCAAGDLAGVHSMLAKGCPVDCADYDRRTGLMVACGSGHKEVVEELLKAGANPLLRDSFGGSGLMEALRRHDAPLVCLLLQHAARPHEDTGKRQLLLEMEEHAKLLSRAALGSDVASLRALLDAGAQPGAAGAEGRTPLHIAAAEGELEAVQLLVEVGGADPLQEDRWGMTPLQVARHVGALDVAQYLEQGVAGLEQASG